jgi:hypothetical protein
MTLASFTALCLLTLNATKPQDLRNSIYTSLSHLMDKTHNSYGSVLAVTFLTQEGMR